MHPTRVPQRLFTALALAACASAQTTWYVDPTAPAPGDGTLASPYSSLQYALDQATTLADDIVSLAPGEYVENVFDRRRVSIVALGGPLVTRLRPALASQSALVLDYGSTVTGLTITGYTGTSSFSGALVLASGRAVRCILRDNSGAGVAANLGYLDQCSVVDNGRGVFIEFFGAAVLRNTLVWSNGIDFPQVTDWNLEASYSAGALPPQTVGPNNLVGDPLVWELNGQRHFLRPGSPCIDAGDPSFPLDPDGSRADIGAVPFDASYAPPPTVYCTAKLNSLGCLPAISSSGAASASGGAFTIQCANQRNQVAGLLFYGFARIATPYQGGYLCVQAPTQRTALIDSGGNTGAPDCSGVHSVDFGARIQSGVDPALVPGQVIYAQFWSRDSGASFSTVRSDALRFGISS